MDLLLRLCAVFSVLLAMAFKGNLAVDGKIPVLMWSNDESLVFPNTFVGHTVSETEFKDLYLRKLLDDNDVRTLAVFVQDKLTVGEISLNADVYVTGKGGAFRHTKDLMSEFNSAFLPRVASPVAVLRDLKDRFAGKTHKLKQPYDLADLHLEAADKNLVIVHLPAEQGTSAAVNGYLQNIDDILNNVTHQLQGLSGHFAALYTGKKAHEQASFDQHSGRHLLENKQSENSTGLILEFPGLFLMYANHVSFNYDYGRNSTELSTNTSDWNVTQMDCPSGGFNATANLTCTFTVTYFHPIEVYDYHLTDFYFNMDFATSYGLVEGYWYLKMFSMNYKNSSAGNDLTTVSLDEEFIAWTPFGFSYHCHDNPPIYAKQNQSAFGSESLFVAFKAFQVQVFEVGNGFGYYNDCVGFFTIPIWSAIICSAVLLSILFFGIIMLMNIKTMDRLDDPKGKTISVTVTD